MPTYRRPPVPRVLLVLLVLASGGGPAGAAQTAPATDRVADHPAAGDAAWAARVGGREALDELAPEEPLNRLYLAEAILEHAPERRADALARLRALLRRTPDPDRPVEEAAARRQAREILNREGGSG